MLQERVATGTIWLAFSFGGLWLGRQYAKNAVTLTSKDKSSREELEQTDYACELKDGQAEVGELEAANEIKVKTLKEMCGAAYRVIPTSQETIKTSDTIKASGTLMCSVCEKDFELDVHLRFEGFFRADSHQGEKCPHCGALIDIYGLSTSLKESEPKFWILVLRRTAYAFPLAGSGAFRFIVKRAQVIGS